MTLSTLPTTDAAALAAFLADPARPQSAPSYHTVQGLLFAVACAPDVVLPSEWLPLIVGDDDASDVVQNEDELRVAIELIFSLYTAINDAVI